MTIELPKAYEAISVEPDVYSRWEQAGCFKAGAAAKPGKPTYTIAIPPPNVTGVLHMGHALNNTLQDTLIRWKRMQGFDTLWQPGTDHAGIATESVVTKQIQDNAQFVADLAAAGIVPEQPADPALTKTATGLDRDRFGRSAFLKAIWFWKERSGGAIIHQLRKLGSSCDWTRTRFTMDDGLSTAVRRMFVALFKAGLIYRGTRMVNWCPVQKTALADDEVEMIEKSGSLWKLKYDLVGAAVNGIDHIVVETTRPETFFGDTAVAVHPEDERYRALIGRMVRLPIVNREIPIIADDYAKPDKGSGAVKITPAHDPNDYAVGQRHGLALIRVIGFDGRMSDVPGAYHGLDRFECRKKLLKDFEASGVLLGKSDVVHAVGHSYRSNAPIEPMVTEQWFVKMQPLAERAVAETRNQQLHFHPERWTSVYEHWLSDVRDWCISRQIWWGHRIPAWHCGSCEKITVAEAAPTSCAHCGAADLRQDPDVLDTWFSSALWPYSTLGWPQWNDADAKRYFPTNTLVTDRGIIFFWVARMVMTSLFANDTRPFDDVYIHGTVLDERGVKMSKSLGNGIDPIIMIQGGKQEYLKKIYDCPGYGADAVRYTLLDMTTEGQDLKLSPAKFETGRNFANKVWNAGRFLLMNVSERPLSAVPTAQQLNALPLGFAERWILDRLQTAICESHGALERWRFNDYVSGAYRFFRDDLCDWYVEWAKTHFKAGGARADMAGAVLAYCFDASLRLLHPGMPFITEHLWQHLQSITGSRAWSGRFLMTELWPESVEILRCSGASARMERLQSIVTAIRHVRNQQQLADGVALDVVLIAADAADLDVDRLFLIDRAHLSALTCALSGTRPQGAVTAIVGDMRVFVGLQGHVDLDKLKLQLSKRRDQLTTAIAAKEQRLANADYVARAPAAQVAETRQLIAREQAELAGVVETLGGL